MNGTYRAKVININGSTATYEYTDSGGFVQISSLLPSGIKIKKGDTVWITVQNGEVVSVGKRRKLLSTPFGIRLIGILSLLIVLAVLWLIFFFLKKIIIAFAWILIILIVFAFIFVKFRQ